MSNLDIDSIIKAIQTIIPQDQKDPVALHEPSFKGNEWTYVKDCIDSTWVSSVGKYVDLFEAMIVDITGVKKAVAVVNGTTALQIALKLAGVKRGDEVLVPALTFVATANAVSHCGAIPHFVDSEEKTLGLDPHKLRDYLRDICRVNSSGCKNKYTGRTIKAVVPMHTFGHPVDLDPLMEICNEDKIAVIEDAAESLGSFYKGRHTGNWGKVSAVSFNGNKIITTGGGGAILTNDEKLGDLAKHLITTARVPHKWKIQHDKIGFNYRLPNINASLGCAQLEQLPGFLIKKRDLSERYGKVFEHIAGVHYFTEPDYAKSNYWLNVLILDDNLAYQRDELLEMSNNLGITTRPVWTLMHRLPMFQECPRMDLSISENLEKRIINLPSSATLII